MSLPEGTISRASIMKDTYKIAVVHGDGIGPEVARAAVAVLQAGVQTGALHFAEYPAGVSHFLETGDSFPVSSFEGCRAADAILHGAAGIPGVVHRDGTEAGLDFTLTLRFKLDLFAKCGPSSSTRACRLHSGARVRSITSSSGRTARGSTRLAMDRRSSRLSAAPR